MHAKTTFPLVSVFFSPSTTLLQSELQALLKRIDARRKEHIKQRNLDSKRLLQRNRNVQTVLESKQNVEGQKLTEEIKKARPYVLLHQVTAFIRSLG